MIIYISGVQGAGKTTLCNVVTSIKRDLDMDDKIITQDMDVFIKQYENGSNYFSKTDFQTFLDANTGKTIILCGLLSYTQHFKAPEDTIYRYIEMDSELLKKNCLYRFFNRADIYNFLTQPLFKYFKISFDSCEWIVNERVVRDEKYLNQLDGKIVLFKCFASLIRDVLYNIKGIDYENIDIEEYINNYLTKLNIKNYSIITIKIILLFLYFLPSYIMKGFRFNLWMPIYYFFFPQFYILDVINLLFFLSLLKRLFRKPVMF